jgi:hypothetical protein
VESAQSGSFNWQGSNGQPGAGPALRCTLWIAKEDWGGIDPAEPLTRHFYGGTYNGSRFVPAYTVTIVVPESLDAQDGVRDGHVTFNGYTDRWGRMVSGCSLPGADCVPLKLTNMKVGRYEFRADTHGINSRDFDVMVDGKSLIQYPN